MQENDTSSNEQKLDELQQNPNNVSSEAPFVQKTEAAQQGVTAPVNSIISDRTHSHSPGVLVLQWLTYAFWLWFGVALLVLVGMTVAFFIAGNQVMTSYSSEPLAYALAAVIVMFLISAGADLLYSRYEARHKVGASSMIMLIHAVIFSLVAVGAFVVTIFALISMVITSSPTSSPDGPMITLLTAVVGVVAYGAMAVRTVFVGRIGHIRKIYWGLMTLLGIGWIIASIAGPISYTARTRDDSLIERALPTLHSSIADYVNENGSLPKTLDDVKSNSYNREAVQLMIDRKLVHYIPNSKESAGDYTEFMQKLESSSVLPSRQNTTYHYQLCVTYQEAKGEPKNFELPEGNVRVTGTYLQSSDTENHPKGEMCYDLSATNYSYN